MKLITEATYNLNPIVDEIYDKEIRPSIERIGKKDYVYISRRDITRYLTPVIKQYSKKRIYSVKLTIRPSVNPGYPYFYTTDDQKAYYIRIPIATGEIPNHSLKSFIKEMISHEITHVVDSIRSKGEVEFGTLIGKKRELGADYSSATGEINAFISQLQYLIKDRYKKVQWNKLSSMEGFRKFLYFINPSFKKMEKGRYEMVENGILRRLARENLLPEFLKR